MHGKLNSDRGTEAAIRKWPGGGGESGAVLYEEKSNIFIAH